jgi:hypothetical protein
MDRLARTVRALGLVLVLSFGESLLGPLTHWSRSLTA